MKAVGCIFWSPGFLGGLWYVQTSTLPCSEASFSSGFISGQRYQSLWAWYFMDFDGWFNTDRFLCWQGIAQRALNKAEHTSLQLTAVTCLLASEMEEQALFISWERSSTRKNLRVRKKEWNDLNWFDFSKLHFKVVNRVFVVLFTLSYSLFFIRERWEKSYACLFYYYYLVTISPATLKWFSDGYSFQNYKSLNILYGKH